MAALGLQPSLVLFFIIIPSTHSFPRHFLHEWKEILIYLFFLRTGKKRKKYCQGVVRYLNRKYIKLQLHEFNKNVKKIQCMVNNLISFLNMYFQGGGKNLIRPH